jgi:hypothetical protein
VIAGPTRFNPPLISLASGAWKDKTAAPPRDRTRIVGPASDALRVRQRGVLLPDFTYADDWRTKSPLPTDEEGSKDPGSRIIYNSAGIPMTVSSNVGDGAEKNPTTLVGSIDGGTAPKGSGNLSLISRGRNYGFRFHYNPSQISMSVAMNPDVNPAMVMAGQTTALPMGLTNMGSIGITLYLNRIEDMGYIEKKGSGYALSVPPDILDGLYDGRRPNQAEMEGIANRGTEYDLEFLFRTIMGRPFPTNLRGMTADLGLIWGTPTQLWLSRRMRYRGRVSGISWSHRSFNRFMVPMWTEVSLQFSRYPDVASWNETPLNEGYQSDRAMGYKIPVVAKRS